MQSFTEQTQDTSSYSGGAVVPPTSMGGGLADSLTSDGYVDKFCCSQGRFWPLQFSQGNVKLSIPADWTYTDITCL